ncbi:hypothetical protein ACES2L_02210 [Bdellovibrio bacteriovorus]
MRFGIVVCTLLFIAIKSNAGFAGNSGKTGTIQEVLESECKMKATDEEALLLIRALYLTCVPGTKVFLDENCEVRCLKSNDLVGR